MAILIDEMKEILNFYENMIDSYKAELRAAPKGRLYSQNDGENRVQMLYGYRENGKLIRYGVNKNERIQRVMARKEFVEKAVRILEHNIQYLSEAIGAQIPFDPDAILKSMTNVYAMLPEDYFFDRESLTIDLKLDTETEMRINRHSEWGSSEYNESMFKAENKNMRSSRGKYVRSKSELLIIESLYKYNIPHHYEEERIVNGIRLVPDYTFMGGDDRPFFWDHLGMMDDPNYAKRNLKKLNYSYEAGIIPGDNLILSFDRYGTINMGMIEAIINTEVIPRL